MCERSCKTWWKRFQSGDRTFDNVDDKKRPGRPRSGCSADNIQDVKAVVDTDKRVTISQIQEQTGLTCGTVHKILKKDLQLSRVAAKFVPKMLLPHELQACVDISK